MSALAGGPSEPAAARGADRAQRGSAVSGVRVRADRDVCIGAGVCVMTAEEVFDQDDAEGLVVVLSAHPRSAREALREAAVSEGSLASSLTVEVAPEHVEAAARAVAACPSGALRLDEG